MEKKLYIVLLSICILTAANAAVIQTIQGVSATGSDVIFKSELTIVDDLLTIQLFNISPNTSNSPDDLLSSYFLI